MLHRRTTGNKEEKNEIANNIIKLQQNIQNKSLKVGDKKAIVIALTANAVSGAREMFMREGFDGFIAKPMSIPEFEHVMLKVLAQNGTDRGGQAS